MLLAINMFRKARKKTAAPWTVSLPIGPIKLRCFFCPQKIWFQTYYTRYIQKNLLPGDHLYSLILDFSFAIFFYEEIPMVSLHYWTFLFVQKRSKFFLFMPSAKAASTVLGSASAGPRILLVLNAASDKSFYSHHFEDRTSWTRPPEHSPAAENCHVEVSERSRAMCLLAKSEFTQGYMLLHRASVVLEK